MKQLPIEFEEYTRTLFGEERYQQFIASFDAEPPVSIRLNPFKPIEGTPGAAPSTAEESSLFTFHSSLKNPVPWCRNAFRLESRPDFTLDPLLHAGCYYVQEAGSMFLDEVLKQLFASNSSLFTSGSSLHALDLCAAPGGKSTLLRAALPEECVLYSNEPDHRRANILMENMQKQGHPNVVVTNNYARDYQKSKLLFDLILTDVPCSGEGMFRKDAGAIGEWSIANVLKCRDLQRSIIEDIWPCLREGGILIYSTCTFNTRENEENVKWICEELGAEIIPIEIKPEWGITGSLLEGFTEPVYRFIPGITPTEGLFMAVLKKAPHPQTLSHEARGVNTQKALKCLKVLSNGEYKGEIKGKAIIPEHAEALLINLPTDKYPHVELDLDTALHYLRREAIVLPPEAPRGYVIVTYKGKHLGFVKNLGNRANNMYPQEWRIRYK